MLAENLNLEGAARRNKTHDRMCYPSLSVLRSAQRPEGLRWEKRRMAKTDPFALFPYQAIVDRPKVTWPNGARVAVWVIPNIEHFHLELGPSAPDIRNYSRRDYGNRVGVWRLMEVMDKHRVRGTVALNGEVARHYLRIMQEVGRLQWELMGHGLTNSAMLTGLGKDD